MITAGLIVVEFDLQISIVVVIAEFRNRKGKLWPARFLARNDHIGLMNDGERIVLVGPPDLEKGARLEEVRFAQVDGAQFDDQILFARR